MAEKKITVQCCVPACFKTNHMEPQILFFPFPKRREMQERWLMAIRRPELKKVLPTDKPFHMFICLDHFKKSDIVNVGGRTCLKAGVIPSVFKWMEPEKKPTPTNVNLNAPKAKVKGLEGEIVQVSCGGLEAQLYREKFYCPGIHRECIMYNNQFITPKMFMIMGDKERLKDWKNAVRIQGVKIRKFIESRQLDFYKHQEFCTGRCVARLPVNLFRTKSQPPDKWVNTSGDISNVRFLETDRRPEFKIDTKPYVERQHENETENENQIEMDEEAESDESIDKKPDLDTLNALLKNPIPRTMTQGAVSEYGITDNQVFWRGVVKLGLIDKCFSVIKDHMNNLQSEFVVFNVRQEDAHELSCIVREMGLSNNLQHLLASCKQDMDNHCDKLDKEMEELKQKVSHYESRRKLLKKRSEEFNAILNLNTPKAASYAHIDSDDSDIEPEVHFEQNTTPSPKVIPSSSSLKRPSSHSPVQLENRYTKKIRISDGVMNVFVKDTVMVNQDQLTQTVASTEELDDTTKKVDTMEEDSLPKIVSVTSINVEEKIAAESPPPVVTDNPPDDEVVMPAINPNELSDSMIASHVDTESSADKKENVRTVLWVKSNGTSEYITLSNNSESKNVDEGVTVCSTATPSPSTSSSVPAIETVITPVISDDPDTDSLPMESNDASPCKQRELDKNGVAQSDHVQAMSDITADGDGEKDKETESTADIGDELEKSESQILEMDARPSESEQAENKFDQSNNATDEIPVLTDEIQVTLTDEMPESSTVSQPVLRTRKVSKSTPEVAVDKEEENLVVEKSESARSVSPLFGDEMFVDFIAARRSSRKRVAKVKDDL